MEHGEISPVKGSITLCPLQFSIKIREHKNAFLLVSINVLVDNGAFSIRQRDTIF